MGSISNGCPVCSGKLESQGEHNHYVSKCVKGCYHESFNSKHYAISVFDKTFSFYEDSYDVIIEKVNNEIDSWKENMKYVSKWLELKLENINVKEYIGPGFVNKNAIRRK